MPPGTRSGATRGKHARARQDVCPQRGVGCTTPALTSALATEWRRGFCEMRDAEQSSRYQGDLPDCGNQFEGSKAKCCRVSSFNLTHQNKEKHFKSIYYLRKIGGTIASLLFCQFLGNLSLAIVEIIIFPSSSCIAFYCRSRPFICCKSHLIVTVIGNLIRKTTTTTTKTGISVNKDEY